jgi:hypothetical protein
MRGVVGARVVMAERLILGSSRRLTLEEAMRCRARAGDLTGLEVASPDREV